MAQPLEYEQLSYNGGDGAQVPRTSTDLLGFWGATPTTRYVGAGAASTYLSHGQSTATASTYGLDSAAAVTSLVLQVSTITRALRNCGLID